LVNDNGKGLVDGLLHHHLASQKRKGRLTKEKGKKMGNSSLLPSGVEKRGGKRKMARGQLAPGPLSWPGERAKILKERE